MALSTEQAGFIKALGQAAWSRQAEAEEPGAPTRGQEGETGLSSRPHHGQFGTLESPNEELKWPLKAFVFPRRATREGSPLPSQPAGGATINPEPDPGGGTGAEARPSRGQAMTVCKTSVGLCG